MRYWYRFLRFLGYRWYDAGDMTWTAAGGGGTTWRYFADGAEVFALAGTVDWTSDTIKVYLDDGKLWSNWRWQD
jgi:hypothetical protein